MAEKSKETEIEHAERGGEIALETDLPAIVDIHGNVIKADWHAIRIKANEAEAYEHSLGLWEAMKLYKKALFWSFVASLSIIMEGFDNSVAGGGNVALSQFRQYYGQWDEKSQSYQVSAAWQAGLGQSVNCGVIVGIFISGWLIDKFGYKRTLIAGYIIIMPLIAIVSWAQNKIMLLFGSLLCGLPFGCFAVLGVSYASEICPISLRAFMTGWINVCWSMGGFVATGVTTGTNQLNNNYSFRIPYMTQWIWPIPLLIAMAFCPESPWWLVRHGKLAEAERSARRLSSAESAHRAPEQVANMVRVTKLEQEEAKAMGNSSWLELFKGSDLRRTEITCVAWIVQNACGVIFAGSTTYVFEQAGFPQSEAFNLGLGASAIHFLANFVNFYFIAIMGRRTLYILGLSILDCLLLLIGIWALLGDGGKELPWAKWAQAVTQMVFYGCYTAFIGPVCYSIVGEASSTRLRNKSVALGRIAYAIFTLVMNILNTYMINASAWNWRGKTAFFWLPICFLCIIWCYFRLPEFKHRSYYELDVLFQRRIPARKFKTTMVEPEADQHLEE
ncbi:MFS maltose permease MalP [Xylogone sp. PMI_703]|nr:MFS maltose permease MalP [Xylogone sp. PMI_703]